jgi:hypothetical protein
MTIKKVPVKKIRTQLEYVYTKVPEEEITSSGKP